MSDTICVSLDTVVFWVSLAVPLAGGIVVSALTSDAVEYWYPKVKTPWFTPPKYLFGPVWTILYLLMGESFYLVYKNRFASQSLDFITVVVYVAQLVLNWAWSILFFNQKKMRLALLDIGLCITFTMACIVLFGMYSSLAARLLTPYIAFVTVAMTINYCVWQDNDPEIFEDDGLDRDMNHKAHKLD